MNQELENVLAKAIEKALQVAEQTGEFLIEQAPDLLQQFYAWHTAKSVAGLLWILVPIILWKVFRAIGKDKDSVKYDEIRILGKVYADAAVAFFGVFGSTGIVVAIYGFIYSAMNLLQLLVAPKLYLIEYFMTNV